MAKDDKGKIPTVKDISSNEPKPEEAGMTDLHGELGKEGVVENKVTTRQPELQKGESSNQQGLGNEENETRKLDEGEVKQAFLKRFRKKKDQAKGEVGVESKPEGANSPQLTSVVIQKEISNTQELAEKLYRDIARTQQKEFIVIRIKKRTLLFTAGVLLVIMWLTPLIRIIQRQGGSNSPSQSQVDEQVGRVDNSPPMAPTVAVQVDPRVSDPNILIRIRDNGGEGLAQQMQAFLQDKGYNRVELIDDHESEYAGLGIVVKPEATGLRQEVESILRDNYELSSPSAELTEDSQVDVLVLFGLESL